MTTGQTENKYTCTKCKTQVNHTVWDGICMDCYEDARALAREIMAKETVRLFGDKLNGRR